MKPGPAERAREEAARGPDPAGALPALDRFLAAAGPRAKSLLSRDGAPRALATLLSLGEAPARAVERDPAALAFAMDGPGRPPAAEVEARIRAAAADGAALRRARRRELLRILLADATGAADLDATAGAISDLADAVLRAVLDRELAAAAARDGTPRHADGSPASIACVALGKLGGAELNYSSDVDLLFVRSGEGRCAGGRDLLEHYGAAVGSAVRVLSRPTEDGHLYRVDLRLRPRGAAGALVPRASGAVHYYRSLGRGWERQALLKARPVAGDLGLGASFLRDLEPWVYGRPLLMAEISEIRRLKRDLEGGADAGEGNLKTGRGGIRDIEWVVQFLQLLLGAEHPSVRATGTKEGLRRLRAAEALDDGEARALAAAYDFLRTAEHRLQAADDTQVHALPADEAGVALLARRLGFGRDGSDPVTGFRESHARHAAAARGALDRLVHDAFSAEEEKARRVVDLLLGGGEVGADEAAAALRPFGFRSPAAVFADLRRMERARSPWLPRTRAYFASAAPALLGRAAATPDP
ncbi:MAG TPA: bifunctional [glutamate--ammonia ligase]-adenylyl-L-tyrosine phosphorylase/[glutamate--ammonia-ligase] adenylyltransferase, partial [Planctomycetota bacterium]|nr:bifunctional [glutamate--ammonia ligase]-adenylyl-L-tyrosine phosphorylase/[glutamate--ammonia-ligase] adenylyltransferase [Planctomycetota bacterium]